MRVVLVALFILLSEGCAASSRRSQVMEVNWKSLGHGVSIIGKLGVPLGEAVEIDAVLVSGRSEVPKAKSLYSTYLLRVEKIGPRSLSKPMLMFFASWGDVSLPAGPSDLIKEQEDREAGSWSEDKIHDLEKNYLGRRLHLWVFEEGRFDGYPPTNLPKSQTVIIQRIAEPDRLPSEPYHRFQTVIRVLRILE